MALPKDNSPNGGHDPFSEAHPALHPSITFIPVTPGVQSLGRSSYMQDSNSSDRNNEGPRWNADSSFAPVEEESTYSYSETRPDSPSKAAAGARTGAELLRRLSLVDSSRPEILDIDPRAVHPGLNLTGGLISATFCIPHAVEFRSGADWVRSSEPYVGMADFTRISNRDVVPRRSSIPSPTSPLLRRLGIILW